MQKGYKYRIYPNAQQKVLLARTFGCTRFVWNRLLDQAQKAHEAQKINPQFPKYGVSGYDFVKRLPWLKQDHNFLQEISSVALQQKALDLGRAYQHFFKKQGRFPKFKKKGHRQSFRLMTSGFQLKEGFLYIAKSKTPIKVKWSRELPSNPSSLTISQESNGAYYVSFICEYQPEPTNGLKTLGLDLGIKSFYTDSQGQSIHPPQYYRRAEKRLARAQKALARKQKGSRNRYKARIKVAKLHAKTKQQRSDFLHKLSRSLVDECKLIAIENLNVSGMLKNRHLSKSISDLGWGRFIEFLRYKVSESQWCSLVRIDRWYPSTQTCSHCGHRKVKAEKLKLNQRHWTCGACGTHHDRDTNAAVNIISEALRQLKKLGNPCTEGQFVLLKQEVA